MKEPLQRTKVVIRHLPPSLSQNDLLALFRDHFNDRYNWFCFRPGKSSYKHQRYSRAYVELKKPADVFEFAELLNGHVFVNEKGAQFKAIVEYAPSQRVPKPFSRKDSREGTIFKAVFGFDVDNKDPDYLEFLKVIAKPAENLPSAEIQLERKEAELSGTRPFFLESLAVGRVGRRSRAASASKTSSTTTKRGSEKKKDSAKNARRKDKSTFKVLAKREDQPASSSGKETSASETICGVEGSVGIPLTSDTGKKKILLLKGKEREIPHVPDALLDKQRESSPVKNSASPTVPKQIQRREAGGRLIRKILLNNETRQTQSVTGVQPQQKMPNLNQESGKPLPGPTSSPNGHVTNNDSSIFSFDGNTKRSSDDRFARKVLHGSGAVSEKQEKRTRNKDRPDRVVWTPRRSDVSQANGERLSSSQPTQLLSDSVEGIVVTLDRLSVTRGEMKDDMSYGSKTVDIAAPTSGGSHRHNGRRAATNITKDDGCINTIEGKSSKRRGAAGSETSVDSKVIFWALENLVLRNLFASLDVEVAISLYDSSLYMLRFESILFSVQSEAAMNDTWENLFEAVEGFNCCDC
ncbi:hypothetical protein CUMW_245760 [Citrus unshiu]|uniref:UPF3 domain-containing protein n=1 Tax=Citrus unshiu TaxID=55188 RepID=A0A2H5QN66_CITUN|nr:hypothetical protein CUMW_245760 [Citrus unshiu]